MAQSIVIWGCEIAIRWHKRCVCLMREGVCSFARCGCYERAGAEHGVVERRAARSVFVESVFVESGESAASDAAAASNEQEWGVEYMSLAKTTVEIAEIQKASSGLSRPSWELGVWARGRL